MYLQQRAGRAQVFGLDGVDDHLPEHLLPGLTEFGVTVACIPAVAPGHAFIGGPDGPHGFPHGGMVHGVLHGLVGGVDDGGLVHAVGVGRAFPVHLADGPGVGLRVLTVGGTPEHEGRHTVCPQLFGEALPRTGTPAPKLRFHSFITEGVLPFEGIEAGAELHLLLLVLVEGVLGPRHLIVLVGIDAHLHGPVRCLRQIRQPARGFQGRLTGHLAACIGKPCGHSDAGGVDLPVPLIGGQRAASRAIGDGKHPSVYT